MLCLSASPAPGSRKKRRMSLVLPRDAVPADEPAKDPQCAICMEPMKAMSCGPCGCASWSLELQLKLLAYSEALLS